jgi:glutamate/tyrosine decarboxylase-like PLP-dependent enzyme
MLVSDLDAKISQAKVDGALPFFVSATAGTTVLGAFDPLNDVADVCTKHGLWFHVDVRIGLDAIYIHAGRVVVTV